jgi:hypothetical protein
MLANSGFQQNLEAGLRTTRAVPIKVAGQQTRQVFAPGLGWLGVMTPRQQLQL